MQYSHLTYNINLALNCISKLLWKGKCYFSHGVLNNSHFAFVSLSPLVTIHDGDSHDEETNVGLEGREGGWESRRDWEIKEHA